ncbi:MAG TPA: glycine zipper family protein [Casimicrobiaceae bacterium]|nr:glycine zipper family protein [Casimicrobiaceae bacterium]
MVRPSTLVIAAALSAFAVSAYSQKPIVYPAKGQSAQQKQKDDKECLAWAKQDTGIDPKAASAPPPQQTGPATGGGERVRGAARGAVGGAVIGGIAGDAGTGAAVGAAAGTMAGGARARRNQAAQNEQAKTQQQETLNTYYRAYAACMEGRGYTIK